MDESNECRSLAKSLGVHQGSWRCLARATGAPRYRFFASSASGQGLIYSCFASWCRRCHIEVCFLLEISRPERVVSLSKLSPKTQLMTSELGGNPSSPKLIYARQKTGIHVKASAHPTRHVMSSSSRPRILDSDWSEIDMSFDVSRLAPQPQCFLT